MSQPINERGLEKGPPHGDAWDVQFIVDGATISVSLEQAAGDGQRTRLELAKRAIARLADLQKKYEARGGPARRQIPNTFDYWAYRND